MPSANFDPKRSSRLIKKLGGTIVDVAHEVDGLRAEEICNALVDLLGGALASWERQDGAEVTEEAIEQLPDFLRHLMTHYRKPGLAASTKCEGSA